MSGGMAALIGGLIATVLTLAIAPGTPVLFSMGMATGGAIAATVDALVGE